MASQKCHFTIKWQFTQNENHQNAQNGEIENGENVTCHHFLPLRKGGSDFGLKTGSRGTPWNSKNAGPGGSDFTKCRFWPFI